MLRPRHVATRGINASNPYIAQSTIPVENSGTVVKTLQNSAVTYTFKEDLATGFRLDSIFYRKNGRTVNNYTRSLWQINLNRKYNVKLPTHIYPSAKYFKAASIVDDTNLLMEWENVPLDEANNFYVDVYITASLSPTTEYLDISASLALSKNASATDSDYSIAGFHIAPLAFESFAEVEGDGLQDHDIFSYAFKGGLAVTDPVENLRPPRSPAENIFFNATRSDAKANFVSSAKDPSTFKSVDRAIHCHPGMMSMPMLSYSNRFLKFGLLIYLYDESGQAGKVLQWWGDGRRINLRFLEVADSEFDNNGIAIYWGNDEQVEHQFTWSVRLQPYESPTQWSEVYAAKLYKQVADTLPYIPKPYWEQAEDGDIPELVADAPAVITSWQGTGKATELEEGIQLWRGFATSGNPTSSDVAFFNHMHTFNFDGGGEGWAAFATGYNNTGSEERAPDYLPVNDYWSGAWPSILAVAKTPIMPYWLHSFTIDTGSQWVADNSGYDLVRKPVGERHATYTDTGDLAAASEYSCLIPSINEEKALETSTGLAHLGATAYRDVFGAYNVGCYAERHIWQTGEIIFTGTTHPRSLYSHFWNKRQIEQVSGWVEAIDTSMEPLWSTIHPGYSKAGFISDSEYMCDSHIKFCSMGIDYDAVSDRYNVYTTDTGFYPLVNGIITTYQIPAPTWHQAVPLWHLVHGNRAKNHNLLGHFGNTTAATNLVNYWIAQPTGIGPAPLHTVKTRRASDEERVGILRGNTIQDMLGYGIELSITQWDPGYTFTNITPDQTGWITGVYTTGVAQFGQKLIRANQAASEYLLNGNLTYPLEEFTSSVDYVWQGTEIRPKFTAKYHGQRSGEHAVMHSVRTHRSDENKLLLTICNWTTGDQAYLAKFDPSAYDFHGVYNIFEIGYGTGLDSFGERTMVESGFFPNQTYYFGADGTLLGPGELKLYEIVNYPSHSSINELCGLKENYATVRYSYEPKPIRSNSVGIAYSYSSTCEDELDNRQVGFRSPATQEIVNNLPQWMCMRQSKDSKGWKLVNSWGMSIERVNEYANYGLRNLFLATADRKQRSLLYKGTVEAKEVFNLTASRNLLLNSAFSMRDCVRTRLPYAWTDYRVGPQRAMIASSNTVSGTHSLKLTAGGSISQLREYSSTSPNYTLSFYYRPLTTCNLRAVIILEGIDGKSYSSEISVNSADLRWQRTSLSVDCPVQIFRYQVVIKNMTGEFLIDCLQLEKGDTATEWQASDEDKPFFVDNTLPFKQAQALTKDNKIAIYPVGDTEEFKFIRIPTRVERRIPENIDLEPFGDAAFTRVVSFHNNSYPCAWAVANNKIQQRDANNEYEVFKQFDLRDVRFFQGRGVGTVESTCNQNIELLTSAVYGDVLFLVSKETYRDTTVRALKIVIPRDPPNGETYLESLTDIEINIPLEYELGAGTNEEISSIGFSEVDSSWMVVNTTKGRRFYYKLYFDYYFVDFSTRAIYTLEDYGNSQIQIS